MHWQVGNERRDVRKTLPTELAEHDVAFHRAYVEVYGRLFGRHRHVSRLAELAHHRYQRPAQYRVPVLQRVERVCGEDVPRQLALVRERRSAVNAMIPPLPLPLPLLNAPPTGPIELLQPQKRTSTSFLLSHLSRSRTVQYSLLLLSKWRCSLS